MQQPGPEHGKPPRNTACARCHNQKIQCPRKGPGPCERCRQAGIECIGRRRNRMGRPRETNAANEGVSVDKWETRNISHQGSEEDHRQKRLKSSLPSALRIQGSRDSTLTTGSPASPIENDADPMSRTTCDMSDNNNEQRDLNSQEPFNEPLMQGLLGTISCASPLTPPEYDGMHNTYGQTAQEILLSLDDGFDWTQQLSSSSKEIEERCSVSGLSTLAGFTPTSEPVNPSSLFTRDNPIATATIEKSQDVQRQSPIAGQDFAGRNDVSEDRQPPRMVSLPAEEPHRKDSISQLADLCLNLYKCSKLRSSSTNTATISSSAAMRRPSTSSSKGSSLENVTREPDGIVGADAALSASQDLIQILQSTFIKPPEANILPQSSGYATPVSPFPYRSVSISHDKDFRFDKTSPSASNDTPCDPDSTGRNGTTILLTLTCYLRLLHVYQPLVQSILQQQQLLQSSNISHVLDVRVGNFSPSSTSGLRTSILVEIISHMLNRIEKEIRLRLSPMAPSHRQEQNTPSAHCFQRRVSPGGRGHARDFSSSARGDPSYGLGQNMGSENSTTSDVAYDAFNGVLEEMSNLEFNLKKDLNSLKCLLLDAGMT